MDRPFGEQKILSKPVQIPVFRPELPESARRYVLDCLDSGWISSLGDEIARVCTALRELAKAAA